MINPKYREFAEKILRNTCTGTDSYEQAIEFIVSELQSAADEARAECDHKFVIKAGEGRGFHRGLEYAARICDEICDLGCAERIRSLIQEKKA